jgi:flagellar protein FlaG
MDVAKIVASSHPQTLAVGQAQGAGNEAGSASPASPRPQQRESKAEKPEDIVSAAARIRDHVQSLQRDLNFSVDDSTGQVVVRVVDGDSGTVVRQIPSEDILRLAERLDEMRSLLFEAKA